MKTFFATAFLVGWFISSQAATTINPTNRFSHGANIGWIDWRGDTNSGAVIGEYVCAGFIYAANVGWINLGNGLPTNGVRYQNLSAGDFGVNHDGIGNLRGLAYGANIGWINFESNGAAHVDLSTGRINGGAYSANCGWITLSNAFAFVQTDRIQTGTDSDGDGIPDAWERTYANTLSAFSRFSDTDGDGVSDLDEYLADTDPLDPASALRITHSSVSFDGARRDDDFITWTSRPTRFYQLAYRTNFTTDSWHTLTATFPPDGATTTRDVLFGTPSPERYFRVQAVKPLSP